MPHIVSDIEIEAPASVVYRALLDQSRYDEWNPLFRLVRGRFEKGALIVAKIDADGIPFVFDARVTRVEPDRALAWRGPSLSLLRPIVSGEHSFEVIDLGNGRSRFVHSERFEGALMGIEPLWNALEKKLRELYPRFDRALKKQAEALVKY